MIFRVGFENKRLHERGAEALGAPAVDPQGSEVQLVLGLKQEHFGSDLHDGRRLDGHGDAEERQLRFDPVAVGNLLAVEVLQSPLELQSLVWVEEYQQLHHTWTLTAIAVERQYNQTAFQIVFVG